MANLLTETPPAPNPAGANALSSSATPAQGAAPSTQQQGGAMPAPPTHAQTVAALRHFDAIRKELGIIIADPALGKSNVKSKIIDGMTRLVAEGFMSTTSAVGELAKVPSEPLQQMKWAKAMMAQARNAENGVLDHYGATNPHFGTVAEHFGSTQAPPMDDHLDHMAALSANYGGLKQ